MVCTLVCFLAFAYFLSFEERGSCHCHNSLSLCGLSVSLSYSQCFVSMMDKKASGIWIWKERREAIVPRQYSMRVCGANGFPYVSRKSQPRKIGLSFHNVTGNEYANTHACTETHSYNTDIHTCALTFPLFHSLFSFVVSPLQGQTAFSEML